MHPAVRLVEAVRRSNMGVRAPRGASLFTSYFSQKPVYTQRRGLCQKDSDTIKPLDGVKILDLTRVLAGPFATMILGDLGAEVIKVEKPGSGDDTRTWGPPFVGNESAYFLSVNRNKKSIAVNMKDPKGTKIIKQLAEACDVLIENYIPGKLTEMGLGYEDLMKTAPHIIYCSITGYGQTGPLFKRAGYDAVACAMSGLMHITGPEDGDPVRPGVAMTDLATGLYAHGAIMAGLLQRTKTGKGMHIDCNLLSSQVACLTHIAANFLNRGIEAKRWGTAHGSIVPYQSDEDYSIEEQSIESENFIPSDEWNSSNETDHEDPDQEVVPSVQSRPRRVVDNTNFQNLLQRLQNRIDEQNILDPWCFPNDPQWGPNEQRPEPIPDPQGRLLSCNWCKCQHCQKMTDVVESICCLEYGQINAFRANYPCVCLHPEFERVVLGENSLQLFFVVSEHQTEKELKKDKNRNFRWMAYRVFTGLIYGFLGKGHRVPIPSCVICTIRHRYPDPDQNYTGFRWIADYNSIHTPFAQHF